MAIRVYIDQGHNPVNPNAGAEGNGYREQDIVYRVGRELYSLLIADPNFSARLSRETPETVLGISNADSLRLRVEGARAFDADLFLSLHTNAAVSPSAGGSEALVYSAASPAYRIAEALLQSLTEATGFRNRGVKLRPGLYVLARTPMPAVLLELGFITNPYEATYMYENPRLFARGIYNGLRRYYGIS
jgi:N-acetylmuramoyl-L-alanine amidase